MCKRGFTGINTGLCKMCEPGTYKAFIGSEICSKCPVGKYASVLFGSVSEDNCSKTFTVKLSFTLNVAEESITNDIKIQIRENVAEKMGIDISKVSELTFRSVTHVVLTILAVFATRGVCIA